MTGGSVNLPHLGEPESHGHFCRMSRSASASAFRAQARISISPCNELVSPHLGEVGVAQATAESQIGSAGSPLVKATDDVAAQRRERYMYPSATLCRAQEAIQLNRANGAALENERAIATKAAKAWGIEASAAEDREARGERVRLHRLAHPPVPLPRADNDHPSENPDLGFPSA